MKQFGKVSRIRAKGCQAALDLYYANNELDTSQGYAYCQYCGEPMHRKQATAAHKAGRPHLKPGFGCGEGEDPHNIWAMHWKCHHYVDTHPALKRELMKQPVSCAEGGVLEVDK